MAMHFSKDLLCQSALILASYLAIIVTIIQEKR